MKLRMRSNSLRLRLTRSEVAVLMQTGAMDEKIEFPNGAELLYGIVLRSTLTELTAQFDKGVVSVWIPERDARDWAATDRVGMEGQAGPLTVLVEKDFQCKHGEQDPDAFEGNPDCTAIIAS